MQRVAADMGANFFYTQPVSDQIVVLSHIHTHETGVADGRAGDAQVNFTRSGVAQHLQQRARRIAAHNAVIDHHQAAVTHIFFDHVEFQRHTLLAQRVGRLDKSAPNIAVLDEAIVIGNFGHAAVANCRRDG